MPPFNDKLLEQRVKDLEAKFATLGSAAFQPEWAFAPASVADLIVPKAYIDAADAKLHSRIDSECLVEPVPPAGSLVDRGWVNNTKLPLGSPNHREHISVLGSLRAFVVDNTAVFYNDAGYTQQVPLEGIFAVVHSFQLVSNSKLVVIAGREALEYALPPVPLPASATLVGRETVLTDRAQTAYSIRLASGAVVVAAAENIPNCSFSLAYRSPEGKWTVQGHVEIGSDTALSASHQHALAQHPATGKIWLFDISDSSATIAVSLWNESPSGLVFETATPRYLARDPIRNSQPRDGNKSPYVELPELCAIPDRISKRILLAYQGIGGELPSQPHTVLVSCETPTESSPVLIFESTKYDAADKQVASITIARTADHIVLSWDESSEATQHPRRFVRVIANDGKVSPPYELFAVNENILGGVRSYGRPDAFDLYSGQINLLPAPHADFRLIQNSPLWASVIG